MTKTLPFKMRAADRVMLDHGPDDLTAFTQWYFDGWTPLPYQQRWYHAPQKNKLLVSAIRTGKTKGVAAGMLHYAFYNEGVRLANASISADQASIVYTDAITFASSPRFQHWVAKDEKHPYPRIVLVNGSEIWFRSVGYEAELWRGWEFDWINVDEAAYITREMAITTLKGRLIGTRSLRGRKIPRAGQFSITTSPKGKGWLFDWWKKGAVDGQGRPLYPANYDGQRFFCMRARMRDNIYLSEEQIAEAEATYTKRMIEQEMEGLFLDSDDTAFQYSDIIRACTNEGCLEEGEVGRPEVEALNKRVAEWCRANKRISGEDLDFYQLDSVRGHFYLQTWDLGKKPTKSGRNAMVGGVFDISTDPWELVGYRYAPGATWGQVHEWIKQWDRKYSQDCTIETITDATGKGDVVNERLEEEENISVDGIIYSAATKPQLIHAAQLMFEKGWLIMPFIRRAVDQLQSYEIYDKDLAQDIVMMLCQGAYRGMQRTRAEAAEMVKDMHRPIAATWLRNKHAQMDRYNARRQASRTNRSRR